MSKKHNYLSPISGLDLVRVTEAAALSAGRWMGMGKVEEAHKAAAEAIASALDTLDIDGRIVIGEEGRLGGDSLLNTGQRVGNGNGPEMDVIVDPIDGTNLLASGLPDAISAIGVAPRGSMWAPKPAVYMEKIVVNGAVASFLVPQCLEAPPAWTLALVARAKKKKVRDLVVFVLDRPRHQNLIEEIRTAGARVLLRSDGDISGAMLAASPRGKVDILMGIGGVLEGVLSACAVKALGGAMLGSLSPQSEEEKTSISAAGLDLDSHLTSEELVVGNIIFFAATGISDGMLLSGVRYHGAEAETESVVLRNETGTRRVIHADHTLKEIL